MRRRGIGHALIQFAVVAWAKEFQPAKKAFLEVRASNLVALRFYERNGFEDNGASTVLLLNPREDALVLAAAVT